MSRSLVREVRLRCSVERAFEAFTANIDAWWPPGHRRFESSTLQLETRVGGRFVERSAAGDELVLGEVRLCDPPRRIAYSWYPGAFTAPTEVEVRFEADGDHTQVTVTHAEGRAALADVWPNRVDLFRRAWEQVLPALAAFADQGRSGPTQGPACGRGTAT